VTLPPVRPIAADELRPWIDIVRTAFLSAPLSDDAVAARFGTIDLDRCIGAFDEGGRMCGAARAFPTPLTVPGGEIAAGAVSAVGVLPTHTRRGHLTRLMRHQLADIAERGEPVAALIAAEYPIYGRYGYGPATDAATLRIDARTAAWREPPTGTVEIVDNHTYAKLAGEIYDRARRAIPGHIAWGPEQWARDAGATPGHDDGDDRRRDATKLVWRDADGAPQGATAYQVVERWTHNRPSNSLECGHLVATTARAEHELLRFLASIDWVADVTVALRPVDDPAPLALVDGRVARLDDVSDHTWLRVLDAPAALAGRRYATAARLVIEIDDPLGFSSGRLRLDGGPDGATVAATTATPDLRTTVGALGAAYLGGHSWGRLADAGWVEEGTAGALGRATAMFSTPRAPWGAVIF